MEPQTPIAGAPEPPRSPELDRLVRQVLAPGSTSDHILLTADALDEAAQHLPNPDAATHRRAARLLREAAPHYSGPAQPRPVTVLDEIAAERRRQIEVEGYTAEHDDNHDKGELAGAAAAYALITRWDERFRRGMAVRKYTNNVMSDWAGSVPDNQNPIARAWPYDWGNIKPQTPRRDLIKATALLVAEIERLDRRELRIAEAAP